MPASPSTRSWPSCGPRSSPTCSAFRASAGAIWTIRGSQPRRWLNWPRCRRAHPKRYASICMATTCCSMPRLTPAPSCTCYPSAIIANFPSTSRACGQVADALQAPDQAGCGAGEDKPAARADPPNDLADIILLEGAGGTSGGERREALLRSFAGSGPCRPHRGRRSGAKHGVISGSCGLVKPEIGG